MFFLGITCALSIGKLPGIVKSIISGFIKPGISSSGNSSNIAL